MMKKCYFLIFFITMCASFAEAQPAVFPGGVKSPVIWLQADSSGKVPSYHFLNDTTKASILLRSAQPLKKMNFHAAVLVDNSDSIAVHMRDSSINGITIFSIYQSFASEKEALVWHLQKAEKTWLVTTTSRAADLDAAAYMSFRDLYPAEPKLNTYYQQFKKEDIGAAYTLKFGSKPAKPSLPVLNFYGLIPEAIVYPRVLTAMERLRVGSYLALKYGVTFKDPTANYVSSASTIIWNGNAYPEFYHDVAGIARDDSSGLFQTEASSANRPGLLTVSAVSKLNNNNFIVWGHNDEPTSEAEKQRGVPHFLKRKWLINTTGADSLMANVKVDTRQFDVDLPPGKPVYWLVKDPSGKGDFSLPSTTFSRMSSIDTAGVALFQNVSCKGGAAASPGIIGFLMGEDLLASVTVTDPLCNEPRSGSAKIKIWGGQAPFNITLTSGLGEITLRERLSKTGSVAAEHLQPGKYFLLVEDAGAHAYRDTFFVNNIDGPKPLSLASVYTIPKGGLLKLRADSLMSPGTTYHWAGPNGYLSNTAVADITVPGKYELTCTLNGCSFEQDVNISAYPKGAFGKLVIYPNPSNGAWSAQVSLDRPSSVTCTVLDIMNAQVSKERQSGAANYRFSGFLKNAGVYLLRFDSDTSTQTQRLIIVN